MKKVLRISLVLVLLGLITSCGNKWQPFTGDEYEYYYSESGRNRLWEEDIIELANNYLTIHPYLIDKEILCYYYNFNQGWNNTYDRGKKDQFLSYINEIIPNISNLSDLDILYEIQKAIAKLEDVHSMIIDIPYESGFPICVEPFYENDILKYYITVTLEEYQDLLFKELISINDIPIEEIVERICTYISADNSYWAKQFATQWGSFLSIQNTQSLVSVGVLGKEEQTAKFTYQDKTGVHTIELPCLDNNQHSNMTFIKKTPEHTLDFLNEEKHPADFWYEMISDDILYLRIAAFNKTVPSLIECISNVSNEIKSRDSIDIIVDIRSNPGGQNLEGESLLLNLLEKEKVQNVYVLIDSSTVSQAVSFASRINTEIEKAILVGTPAAEGSENVGYSYDSYFTMTNHGYTYGVANIWYQNDPNDNYNALQPEIVIRQNIVDFQSGIDSVLSKLIKDRVE